MSIGEGADGFAGQQEGDAISVKSIALKARRAFEALRYADCLDAYDEIWFAYAAAYGQLDYPGDYEFDWTFDGLDLYRYARALQAVNGNTIGTAANYLRAYIRLSLDNPEMEREIRLAAGYVGASGNPDYDSAARAYVRAMESAKAKGREGLSARFATALIASGKDLVDQMSAISMASWNPYDGANYQSIEDLCYQLSFGEGLSDEERGALARLSYEKGREDLFGILYHNSAGFNGDELKAMAKDPAKLAYLDVIASNAAPGDYDDPALRAALLSILLSSYDAATLDSLGLLESIPRFTGEWFLEVPKGPVDEARWNAWKLFHDKEIMALYENGAEGAAAIEDSIEKAFKSMKVLPKSDEAVVKAGAYDAAGGFLSVNVGDLAVLRYRGAGASSGAGADSWKAKANFEFDSEAGAYSLVSIALSGLPGGKTALIGVPGRVSKTMEEGRLTVSWKAPAIAPSAISAQSFDLGTLDAPKELDSAKPSPITGLGPRSEGFSFQLGPEDAAAFRVTYSYGDFDYVLQIEQRGEPFVRTKRYLSYSIELLSAFAAELASVDSAAKAVAVIDGFHGRIKSLLALQSSMQDEIPRLEAGDYPIEVDILLSELQEKSDAYSKAFQERIGPLYGDASVQAAMERLSEAISE
jgi:hypothetical protein